MATCLPDWFARVTQKDDQLILTVLETKKAQTLLTAPDQAQEVLADSDMTVTLVRP